MKIIKTSEQIEQGKKNRQKANIGCDICPCCKSKNVEYQFTHSSTEFKIFSVKFYDVDRWKCNNCGTIYESEPYQN